MVRAIHEDGCKQGMAEGLNRAAEICHTVAGWAHNPTRNNIASAILSELAAPSPDHCEDNLQMVDVSGANVGEVCIWTKMPAAARNGWRCGCGHFANVTRENGRCLHCDKPISIKP
jgi:hypothetical protein